MRKKNTTRSTVGFKREYGELAIWSVGRSGHAGGVLRCRPFVLGISERESKEDNTRVFSLERKDKAATFII